ncbi:MAG: type II secretion system secretin GspD [Proteobacteria bacterium]|nr:type II secretion system secretin GspD [Pseudomonadota bacterium]
MAVLLVSCATLESTSVDSPASENTASSDGGLEERVLASSASNLAESAVDSERAQPVLYRGNDKQVKLPPAREAINFIGKDVSLNFENAPLSEVMHAIMGDILGLDYVVDQPVKGTVTLRTRTPVPRDQVFSILESLLKANKVLMIRGEDNRFLITGSQQASRLSPGVSSAKGSGTGFGTVVIPLRYISAANMAEILKPVADESAFVRVDNARNLLMLAGTGAQLDGWLDMILTFDVDLLAGMSVGMFPLENSSVEEMHDVLIGLLGKSGAAADLSHLVRLIPIKRLNSILVVTPRAHYLDTVGAWVERLDAAPDSNFEKRLYVFPVQNTTATRLADLLSSIYTGSGGSSGSRGSSNSGSDSGFGQGQSGDVAPGLSPEKLGSSSGTGGAGGGGMSAGISDSFGTSTGGGSSQFMLDEVRVVADEENNALMIYATGKEYRKIKVALEQLDVVATQVIIEASILEVSLTDELKYGLEWTFNNSIGSDYDGVGVLAAATGGPAAVVPGFSYTVTNAMGDISAVLNALAQESLINVISTPSVMVLDNHVAYIHVGDQVPVNTGTTVSSGGTTVENITFKDTGVKLSVKPSVNAGGLVTMDIEQSVTDVGLIDPATNQRSFLERSISSRVAVRSSESVVLGGLIRENATDASSGIPFLHSLPLIGPLFGTVSKTDRRTELLVIITPRVIYNETDLREVSEELRSQVRHMELIELPK